MQKKMIPYAPRPLQLEFHSTRARFAVMVCHRRFGKTVAAINDILRQAIRTRRSDYRAAYIAPFMRQAKSVAWDYLKFYAGAIPQAQFNETELRCDLPNGARIRLLGAENAEALRGIYLDDIVIDEPADIKTSVWARIIRPCLADRKGRALFIGTPKGANNLLYDMWQEALAKKDSGQYSVHLFKASESGYVDALELESAKNSMDADEYAQEFECSFAAAIRGAYYAQIIDNLEQDNRITNLIYEPSLLVHTAWDLGMDDSTAIWFYQLDHTGSIRIIDYYENSGEGLPHYAAYLLTKSYIYGRHIAPHDIMVREIGTGKSRLEVARGLGIKFEPCPMMPIIDGIQAVRLLLRKTFFDITRCNEGLRALRHYRKEWKEQLGTYADKPVHDWSSHAADAMRYLAVSLKKPVDKNRQIRTENKRRRY